LKSFENSLSHLINDEILDDKHSQLRMNKNKYAFISPSLSLLLSTPSQKEEKNIKISLQVAMAQIKSGRENSFTISHFSKCKNRRRRRKRRR
jgi:hypothetical protein